MDFLALYVTARLTHAKVRAGRMAAAAAAGAVFALAAAVADSAAAGFFAAKLAAAAACAAGMCVVTFGSVKQTPAFAAISMSLGGIMSALYAAIGRPPGTIPAAPEASPMLFAVVSAASAAISLAWGRSRRRTTRRETVRIEADGKSWELTALVDSGNLLREPISGRAVIVAAAGKLAIDERAMAKRLRLIPAGGVTGERLLAGFLPDRVECGGREVDAVIALDPGAADYNGCDGILPEILLI